MCGMQKVYFIFQMFILKVLTIFSECKLQYNYNTMICSVQSRAHALVVTGDPAGEGSRSAVFPTGSSFSQGRAEARSNGMVVSF